LVKNKIKCGYLPRKYFPCGAKAIFDQKIRDFTENHPPKLKGNASF
jgi:hypothetical protein